jgi:uncharacterized repeat protein (TIGR01451 family)
MRRLMLRHGRACLVGLLALPMRAIAQTPTTMFAWEAHYPPGSTVTPSALNGVVVSMRTSDPFGVGMASNFTVDGGVRGGDAGLWKVEMDASARGQWVGFGLVFAPAVRNLRFTILDLDHNDVFHDSVEVVGWHGTAPVGPLVVSIGDASPPAVFFAPGTFSGRGYVDDSLPDGNISLRFAEPVDSVTFVYAAGPLSDPDPSRQAIGLSDLVWDAEADLQARAAAAATVFAADTLEIVVVVRNVGPAAAVDVAVSDTLTGAASFLSASDGGTLVGGAVVWPLVDSLPVGDSLVYAVSLLAAPSGTVFGVAAATALTLDPDSSDNDGSAPEARVSTTVTERADLVVRTGGPAMVLAAAPLSYTVTVRNDGPSSAAGVTVTDTLPGAAAFVAASDGGSAAGGVVNWPAVALAAGDSVVYTVDLMAPATGTLLAIAAAAAATIDQVAANSDGSAAEARVATAVVERADLVVTLTGPATVVVGAPVGYRIVVWNAGPSVAEDVAVSDTLPAALAFAAASDGGAFAGGVVTWPTVAALAAGDSLAYTVDAVAPVAGQVVNLAAGTSATLDQVAANNDGSGAAGRVSTTVIPVADLVVSLTGPAGIAAADTIEYRLVVRNAATDVVVSDTLPPEAAFVGASGGAAWSGGVLTWPALAALAVDDSAVHTVRLLAPPTGVLVNVGAAGAVTVDPDPLNSDGSAPGSRVTTVVSERADVAVRLSGSTGVAAGGALRYTVTVSNAGPSTAAGVVVTDTLPATVAFVAASGGGTLGGGVVTWPAAAIAAGDSLVRTVDVTAPPTGTLASVAAAAAATVDPDAGDNDGSAAASRVTTQVSERADVAVRVTGPAGVSAAETIAYTIVARNQGPSMASTVVLSDTLPGGTTFTAASDGGTFVGGVVTWPAIPELAAGDSVLRILEVVAPATGTLINVVAATSGTVDPAPANNDGSDASARVTTGVAELADVVVGATGPATVAVSGALRYVVTVRNAGPSTASGVVVTDTLPQGVAFVAASGGGLASTGVVQWPAVALPAGDSVVYTVDAVAPSSGLLSNVVAAVAQTPDPDPSSNDGSAPESRVETRLDLALTVDRQAMVDTVPAGSVGFWGDSARVILGGTDADTVSWSAASGAPWLALSDSTGTGGGVVRWRADLGALRAGTYRDTVRVAALSLGAVDSISVVVLAPAVALTDAVDQLLGVQRLSTEQRRYLDQEGNGDGAYNLGDLLALLDRTGASLSAELMTRLLAADAGGAGDRSRARPRTPRE